MDTEVNLEPSGEDDFTLPPSDIHSMLMHHADILVSKLYSRPGLPRNLVDSLMDDFLCFLGGGFMNILKNSVLKSLNDLEASDTVITDLDKMFNSLSNPFSHLSSEYLRFKHFQSSGHFVSPQKYVIDSRMEKVVTPTGTKLLMKEVTGVFIPLRQVLKMFLELPDAISDILSYMELLTNQDDDGWVSNFIQCGTWKDKVVQFSNDNCILLPLHLYHDDYEPNNPFGPHSEKLGATYISLPCLPPECQSTLNNIFLALLFNSDDRKLYGNQKAFKPLIEELMFLESDGIYIKTAKGKKCVRFTVGLVLGDNLGIHSICGLVESFVANYSCRLCKAHRTESESTFVEDRSLIRTKENYNEDVILNDPAQTGIKELCVFTALKSFEMAMSICVDGMHDLLEGVCHYSMIPVLRHFLQRDPLFLEKLSSRMYMLDFGVDSDNKPPTITPEMLTKNKLKMTAAEMHTFVRLFGILVGDLVTEDDEFWHLYLLLYDIVSTVFAKALPNDIGKVFSVLVKEHHELYCKLTGQKLKPKHHLLLHYGRIFSHSGPFSKMCAMRYEGKHEVLKLSSNVNMSRRNLPFSVAMKQQLALCFRFICNESIRPKLVVGSGQVVDLKMMDEFSSIKRSLPKEFLEESERYLAKWINYKGTEYKQKQLLVVQVDGSKCPQFGEINWDLISPDGIPLFICSPFSTLGYFDHVKGYEIEPDNSRGRFCVSYQNIVDPFPLSSYRMATGESFVVFKNFI